MFKTSNILEKKPELTKKTLPANLHSTLIFLIECSEENLPNLKNAIELSAQQFSKFEFVFDRSKYGKPYGSGVQVQDLYVVPNQQMEWQWLKYRNAIQLHLTIEGLKGGNGVPPFADEERQQGLSPEMHITVGLTEYNEEFENYSPVGTFGSQTVTGFTLYNHQPDDDDIFPVVEFFPFHEY